ncbi:MAG: hypothetical protein WCW84_07740 [Sulfurimonas sp.]|jgi:hypothetical protein
MDVVINELSLFGQYHNIEAFLENLRSIVSMTALFKKNQINLYKNQMFWQRDITSDKKLSDLISISHPSITLFKSHLSALAQPPYWEIDQKHNCVESIYTYRGNQICNTGLAESSQRDSVVVSFTHDAFIENKLSIENGSVNYLLDNLTELRTTAKVLWGKNCISDIDFCHYFFYNTNLCFSELANSYGFDTLDSTQKNEFISSFEMFSSMDWCSIISSDGLDYKAYKPSKKENWFTGNIYEQKQIFKFRITQKYRCFGYRNGDIFHVLRFEIDHKISDKG